MYGDRMFETLFDTDPATSEEELRETVERLERLKSAAAAAQARATARWWEKRCAAEAARDVPARKRGRGLSAEVALARRDSTTTGDRHLGFAKALIHEMPYTLAALEAGVLSEWRATLIVQESACLDVEDRRRLDREICADPALLEGLGNKQIRARAKAAAYTLDPQAIVDRIKKAPADRTVTTRPAADNMVYLTALMPLAQGIACYASLTREADTNPNGRSRGQTMSDTMYERVTGRSAAVPVPMTVNVVISDEALIGTSSNAANVQDYQPIPAALARRMITDAIESQGRVELRRLYATPTTGALVAMESRARAFPDGLARFIRLRDQTCRTPFCDAPIRHIDHASPHRSRGPTSARNGRGCCERCNYTKEQPGWRVQTHFDGAGHHVVEHTTPTGATYRSTAPPIAGGMRVLRRDVHVVAVTYAA